MRTFIPDIDLRKKIYGLLDFAFDIKGKGHDLFFSYSPHVNSLEIRLHIDGWHKNFDPAYSKCFYFDHYPKFISETSEKIITDIQNLINKN